MHLDSCKAVVFDLDGTIYHGNALIDGALELVEHLRSRSVPVFYCTNNSSQTRKQVCERLNGMGLAASVDQLYTAAHATSLFVAREQMRDVFCFGAAGLREELTACGVPLVSDPARAAAVVIGLDPTIDYARISQLIPLRGRECRLIACNRDSFFPGEGGKTRLGCGFIVSMVETLLERKVDLTVGKPGTAMLEMLIRDNALAMADVVMVGDSLESDIAMAEAAGCRSVYLSTGAAAPEGVCTISSLHELRALFGPPL